MVAANKFQNFVQDLAEKVHNLTSDTLNIYLSNTAPNAATHTIKANIAEIATGTDYTGPIDTVNTGSETSGTYTLTGTDSITITANTPDVADFRYVILYNDTPTSPADPLICWWDYTSTVSLGSGESFTVDFGASIATLS